MAAKIKNIIKKAIHGSDFFSLIKKIMIKTRINSAANPLIIQKLIVIRPPQYWQDNVVIGVHWLQQLSWLPYLQRPPSIALLFPLMPKQKIRP